MNPLNINPAHLSYKMMIGVGGIGSGQFFILNGNHTLGREESRSGHFLHKNDYCKLHIITHYIKAFLGSDFKVIPVGKIGDDEIGKKLLSEMKEAGFSLDYIEVDKDKPTLFSFCFLYPDLSGGNLTTDDSACSSIDTKFIARSEKEFIKNTGSGIALAVPEVPLDTRAAFLNMASKYDFFKVASFTSEEMKIVIAEKILKNVDLLCINMDEAINALKGNSEDYISQNIVECAFKLFTSENPNILISITNGKEGSFVWDGTSIDFLPAQKVNVVSTAGAGDAFTAGLITGLTAGLSIKEAHQIASLTGAVSVTSPHTINKELDRAALLEIVKTSRLFLNNKICKLLEEL